ncbi:MAG: RsmF rRNA methyltransferase first C-terminal domain-containing protein [Clostridia bacterium]|nr:RsmF rRNA methyltransferase first C-terminal domain-containing protein [Clostridia bacterium]
MELPKEFLIRMEKLVPNFDKFVYSYNNLPVKSFFINKNKISEEDFLAHCSWNIEQSERGWQLLEDFKVGKTLEHHSGMIYMQELSAMMPTTFLPLKEDDWVIDLCASPGGKSIQVANRIKSGLLVSNEIVKSRANILKSNIERMGLYNVCVTNNNPKELEDCFGGIFDAVVVDAPCSGEGMFRKDDEAILNWSQANVDACAIRQYGILETANKLLKQGGYLLYSTCTFSVEENEQQVANFCSRHNYEIVPLDYPNAQFGVKIGEYNTNYCLRFYPHQFNGEGQFVALLRKVEDCNQFISNEHYFKPINKMPTEYKAFKDFCEANLTQYQDITSNAIFSGNTIYYATNKQIAESGVRLINCGVVLGDVVKGRFEPHHNFVTCFGNRFRQTIELSEQDANKFIKGETLDCELSGYVVVKYNGVVLGFGKSSTGLKNHYPKGLRNV